MLVAPDARHEVDARPSDAVALAIRLEAPIYAAGDVLDRAAALPEPDDDEAGDDEDEDAADAGRDGDAGSRPAPGRRREATGEPIVTAQARDLPRLRELAGQRRATPRGRLAA